MKAKRFIALSVMAVMVFTGSALAFQPEDALTPRPNESVYAVLKLDDTAALLKWIFSEDNVNTFMPLILASENSNDIIGGLEVIRSIVQNTPIRSAALIVGITAENIKTQEPFLQLAFTVSPELNSVVRKISQGSADAKDIAKLILGTESPMIAFAETMIKVERGNDNIMRIDNAVFVKAVDDVILLGLSENEVQESVKALEEPKARLFARTPRKFSTRDFAFLHVDMKVAEVLDDGEELKEAEVVKYFDKPIDVELGFDKTSDRFTFSGHVNIIEALKKEYTAKMKPVNAVKGGHIDLHSAGGASVPVLALGSLCDLSGSESIPEAKPYFDDLYGQLKKRFGITKEEVYALFNGPFSVVVNGNVMFESFKIPALYISQTGKKGAASSIYNTLSKSPHFQKVHEGILQVDSSLSPVSCIIGNAGDKLGIAFAELSSFSDAPATDGAFGELMGKKSVSSFWFDFAGLQSWLNDDTNGVFSTLAPLASILGYGKILDSVREVLGADFSVTSISFHADDVETFYFDFALKNVRAEDGLFAKLVKVYRNFQ